ncbi:MAG: lysozyme inhibitor LprI family protein [Hyphomonadaceae bacterium]
MIRITVAAVLAAFSLPTAAHAQPGRPIDCKDPFFQSESNMCAKADHEKADAEMNAVYEQVLKQFREQDRSYADVGPEYVGSEKALVDSQKTWTGSRHDFCAARGITFTGGSMRAGVVSSCYAMLARSRTEELRWLLD